MNPSEIKLYKVKVPLVRSELTDIEGETARQLERLRGRISPGMSIAVAVGSRGISNIARITRAAVAQLKAFGAEPFVVPSMGSHGGATADGQRETLASYGVTEDAVGAPVRSSMSVVSLGTIEHPKHLPVYMDANAAGADGVLVINRVKPHTDFHGAHESGIVKMLVIGLGKHAQALAVHQYGVYGLRELIQPAAERVIQSGKILGALAIVEDGFDHTSEITFAAAHEIVKVDGEMLAKARSNMARLPLDELDLLLVDEMGKNVSGTGMDTNVIGRLRIEGETDTGTHCRNIAVFSLTPESHGNSLGIGLADFVPRRLAGQVDWRATQENVITSGFLQRGFLPIVGDNDYETIGFALRRCSGQPDGLRVARIKNTLHLSAIYVSHALLDAAKWEEVSGTAETLQFDDVGQMREISY
ncbi:hypothetical protein FACS1894184_08640 [Clostridia bacterium]|nr:hypothetical protein FACS1894184_08640 [Clostridia bacterium]